MGNWRLQPIRWGLIGLIGILSLLTGCSLPQVSAEERLFLNLSIDFLGQAQIPKQAFQGTTVGGLSGITYDRRQGCFYAISDDRSNLAPARFYTLNLEFDRSHPSQPRPQQVTISAVTTLTDDNGQPYAPGTIDPEGIALSPIGSLLVSSEGSARSGIPPFIHEVDLKTGQWQRSLPIPDRYLPKINEAGQPIQGVGDNLGFEALSVSPGGTANEPFRIFAATESALVQDADADHPQQGSSRNRMLHYVMGGGKPLLLGEHLYLMDPPPEGSQFHGLPELLAIDPGGHFLSIERSFGRNGFAVKLFQVTTAGASDITTITSLKGTLRAVEPVRKKLLLDLGDLGIRLDNLEGMTLGPRLPDGSQSLVMISDDNFNPLQTTQLLVFRLGGLKTL